MLIIDVYSFLNFGYYASLADIVKEELEDPKFRTQLDETVNARSPHLFRRFKTFRVNTPTFPFLFLLWCPAVLLPFFSKVGLDVENPANLAVLMLLALFGAVVIGAFTVPMHKKGTPKGFLKKCPECGKKIPIASEECQYCKTKQP